MVVPLDTCPTRPPIGSGRSWRWLPRARFGSHGLVFNYCEQNLRFNALSLQKDESRLISLSLARQDRVAGGKGYRANSVHTLSRQPILEARGSVSANNPVCNPRGKTMTATLNLKIAPRQARSNDRNVITQLGL